MTSLKQEMRQKFEKHSSMAFYENNNGFEDGLLEKIINLAYANLSPYSDKCWHITAVKSPVLLQKLYKAVGEKMITESAMALIICSSTEQPQEDCSRQEFRRQMGRDLELHTAGEGRDLEMLTLSIGYAAKYYCTDSFIVKSFDREAVAREFALDKRQSPAALLCLGFFRDRINSCIPLLRNLYSDTVRIV